MNTLGKSPSTHKRFSESVPKAGTAIDILGHLSVPSQTEPVSSSRTPSPSPLQKGRTRSPKPESTRPKSTLISSEATKAIVSETMGTNLTGGLFGSTFGSSSNSSITQRPSGFFNGDAKPQAGGLFPPVTSAAGGTEPRNSFGNLETVTPANLFGQARVSGGAFSSGSAWGATTSNPSFGGFGNSFGTSQTKRNNNLEWV